MKFKKPIIVGSIIAGVATVASTAVIATQINHQNTKDSPNMMMNTRRSMRLNTERYNSLSYTAQTPDQQYLNRRYSKYHYDDQAYGARYFLKTKGRGDTTWTTVKEGYLYYILNDSDISYRQDITWNIDRTINLENEFKVDVVFDDGRVPGYRTYYNDFSASMRTGNGAVTMGSAMGNYYWTKVSNRWLRIQGAAVGEATWKAYNFNDINDSTANILINPSSFSEVLRPVINNDDVFNKAKLKSLIFNIRFKGPNPDHLVATTRLEIYGNSIITVNLDSFEND